MRKRVATIKTLWKSKTSYAANCWLRSEIVHHLVFKYAKIIRRWWFLKFFKNDIIDIFLSIVEKQFFLYEVGQLLYAWEKVTCPLKLLTWKLKLKMVWLQYLAETIWCIVFPFLLFFELKRKIVYISHHTHLRARNQLIQGCGYFQIWSLSLFLYVLW